MKNKIKIQIWTDGSCTTKGERLGGFGVYLKTGDIEYTYRKGYTHTTTARMEMRAVLTAINMVSIDDPTDVTIYSDSQFVVNSFKCGWLAQWRINNFAGVKNADIWKEIVLAITAHKHMKFNIVWIPGHNKNIEDEIVYGNNIADALANYKTQEIYEEDVMD